MTALAYGLHYRCGLLVGGYRHRDEAETAMRACEPGAYVANLETGEMVAQSGTLVAVEDPPPGKEEATV